MRNFYGTFRPGSNLLQLFLFLHHLPGEIFAYNCFIGHQLQLQPRAGSICEFLPNQKAFIFLFTKKQRELISFFLSLILSSGNEKLPPLDQVLPVGAVGSMDVGDDGGFTSSFIHPIMTAIPIRLTSSAFCHKEKPPSSTRFLKGLCYFAAPVQQM